MKISQTPSLSETPASGDLIPVVDVSDTTEAPTGTTKHVEYGDLSIGGASTPLSDDDPVADGVADPGVSSEASRADHTHPAASLLANDQNYLSTDVTMTTAGTWYDGPSLTLSTGTWLLIGAVHLLAATNAFRVFQVRIHDGTNLITLGVASVPGTAGAGQPSIPVSGIVSPGSTTTYKVQATSSVNGDTLRGSAVKGSYLLAVRIA